MCQELGPGSIMVPTGGLCLGQAWVRFEILALFVQFDFIFFFKDQNESPFGPWGQMFQFPTVSISSNLEYVFFFFFFFCSISMSFSVENNHCLEVVLESSSNFESVSQGEFDCSWWATWWWCHLHLLWIFVSFTGWMKSQIMGEHHLRNL